MEIVIANTAEAFASLLDRAGADSDRAAHETDLSARALFWGSRDKIVVTPQPIDPLLIRRTARLLGFNRVEVWHPARSTLRLSADILADDRLVARLRDATRTAGSIRARPYAVTPEFCALSERLGWGSWRPAAEAAAEIDSKVGFRRIFSDAHVSLPGGSICHDALSVATAVFALGRQGRGAAIKLHNGESGWGLRFVDAEESQTRVGCDALVHSLFSSDPVWDIGPYVVEEVIAVDSTQPGCTPSGEATIDDDGIHFDYLCDQLIDRDGGFLGVCIGAGVEASAARAEVRRQTLLVGEALSARSYRGTYDVDFVLDSAGTPLAVEANVRMTGGSHVIGAARAIFGETWSSRSYVSNDDIRYGHAPRAASDILERIQSLLLEPGDQRGLILSFLSRTRPVMGVIAVGDDRADALDQIQLARRCLKGSGLFFS